MRPASIIFLIVSLILIITGSVLCNRAENQASVDDFDLLEQEEDVEGNRVKTFDFTKESEDDPEVSKISVKVDDIPVEIRGGADRSYVEIYNKPFIFNCYISNKVLTVSNRFDLGEIVESSGSNFEFNGIRKYMDAGVFETKPAKIIIHVGNVETLKQIELDVSGCDVSVSNLDASIDVIVNSVDANITLKEIKTQSSIAVTATGGSVMATDLLFGAMTAETTDCVFTLDETNIALLYPIGYTVQCTGGELNVNGAPIPEGTFAYATTSEHQFTATVTGGSFSLIYSG